MTSWVDPGDHPLFPSFLDHQFGLNSAKTPIKVHLKLDLFFKFMIAGIHPHSEAQAGCLQVSQTASLLHAMMAA